MITSTSNLTIDFIDKAVLTSLQRKEQDLQAAIQKAGDAPTTVDLLVLQQQVQEWSMMTAVQSTLVKELSDAMKGVIQKAG